MTDLHTHILPGMDDGAKTVEESLQLLHTERNQGVDTVVLTPHFYRDLENPERFLKRRRESVLALGKRVMEMSPAERDALPRMLLGAEVAWWPTLAEWDELPELCIQDTKHLLLELPAAPWESKMIDQLHQFYDRTGIIPIIAHLERYLKTQQPEHIEEILKLGGPVQVSADVLLRPLARGRVLKLLRDGQVQLVASDCHNCKDRAPNLAAAMQIISNKLGKEYCDRLTTQADTLVKETI